MGFFSLKSFDTLALQTTIQHIASETKSKMISQNKSQTFTEIFLENEKEGWRQKIDIVQEQPKCFGDIVNTETIRVDSLINIATNKILAIFGRLEPKDYIDLYEIIKQTNYSFNELFKLAKEKDTGLSEFYFANTIADVEQFKTLPNMKIPFDKERFVKFYQSLSSDLLLKIKPEAI